MRRRRRLRQQIARTILLAMPFRPATRALFASVAAALLAASNARAQYTFTEVVVPGTDFSVAHGINNVGQIVGTQLDPRQRIVGFLYSGDGTVTTIDVPGSQETWALDINDAGQVVGFYRHGSFSDGRESGFVYDHGVFTLFDVPNARLTSPYGINNLGQIVGRYYIAGVAYGFLYDHGVFTGTRFRYPDDISDVGQIVGQDQNAFNAGHGVVEDASGALAFLDVPGAAHTELTGINNVGQLAGNHLDAPIFGSHGFVYRNGAFTLIDFPGQQISEVNGINDAGQVIGIGVSAATGVQVNFLATPLAVTATPEPATWALVGSGLLVIGGVARRRRSWRSHPGMQPGTEGMEPASRVAG